MLRRKYPHSRSKPPGQYWNWVRLHVLAELAIGPMIVKEFETFAGVRNQTAQKILRFLESIRCVTGNRSKILSTAWEITEHGEQALRSGLGLRLNRGKKIAPIDASAILRRVRECDQELKDIGWNPTIRREVFRGRPLREIERVILMSHTDATDRFAWTFSCLLGYPARFRKRGRPTREGVKSREYRRVKAYIDKAIRGSTIGDPERLFNDFMTREKPLKETIEFFQYERAKSDAQRNPQPLGDSTIPARLLQARRSRELAGGPRSQK